jgi:hypothetical protein
MKYQEWQENADYGVVFVDDAGVKYVKAHVTVNGYEETEEGTCDPSKGQTGYWFDDDEGEHVWYAIDGELKAYDELINPAFDRDPRETTEYKES